MPFEECFLVESAIESIRISLQRWNGSGKDRIQIVFVDLDDGSVNPIHFANLIKEECTRYDTLGDVTIQIYALSSAPGDRIKEKCEKFGIKYMRKPMLGLKRVLQPYLPN